VELFFSLCAGVLTALLIGVGRYVREFICDARFRQRMVERLETLIALEYPLTRTRLEREVTAALTEAGYTMKEAQERREVGVQLALSFLDTVVAEEAQSEEDSQIVRRLVAAYGESEEPKQHRVEVEE
jgi:hypothetical protein